MNFARLRLAARRLRRLAPGLVAIPFLVVGMLTLCERAVTWDEPVTRDAALRQVEIVSALLRGERPPAWPAQQIPGYYFGVDLARGLFLVAADRLFAADALTALHASQLLLSSGALWLLFGLTHALTGRLRPAFFASAALALAPLFQSHAVNNPKDLPALFTCLLCARAALPVVERGRARDACGLGAALGLALTTRVLTPLMVPVLGLWLLWARPRDLRRRAAPLLLALALGALFALLLWPWLWDDPLGRLREVAQTRIAHVGGSHPVAYLGRTWKAPDLPWHAFAVNLLARTPLLLLACAAAGLAALARAPGRGDADAPRPTGLDAARLGATWVAVLGVAEAFSPARYDAGRHFLPILPGLALLCGVGLDRATTALARRLGPRARAAGALPAAVGAALLAQSAAAHPYPNAFLNAAARAAVPAEAERHFELDYWGHAYPEAAAFLRRAAAPGDRIFAPIGTHLVEHALGRAVIGGPPFDFLEPGAPAWLVTITRVAAYDPATRFVSRHFRPVHRIRHGPGTLAVIYRNTHRQPTAPGWDP